MYDREHEGKLKILLTDLLNSYAHMMINRIIPEMTRLHEAVIYDFLYQYHKSALAKMPKFDGLNDFVCRKK
ncbi:hypothetical protein HDE69_005170 [Pedobacter cryoconitis]|uniref:Thiopeptide-type bacteriocin biosynthesis domain-containing protein n=1 Tax=Pedobacter cryoconitis TaxID=188932 RepID=A0A7W8YYX1_9SPHI|nr:hypothetical protein [Pedobacter cryoconitis]